MWLVAVALVATVLDVMVVVPEEQVEVELEEVRQPLQLLMEQLTPVVEVEVQVTAEVHQVEEETEVLVWL